MLLKANSNYTPQFMLTWPFQGHGVASSGFHLTAKRAFKVVDSVHRVESYDSVIQQETFV